MAKRKQIQILTHVVVAGRKYRIASSSVETRQLMERVDNHVEVIDPKQRTGVLDVPIKLFADLNWNKGQATHALKQAFAKGVAEVSLEFLPAA